MSATIATELPAITEPIISALRALASAAFGFKIVEDKAEVRLDEEASDPLVDYQGIM